MIIIKLTASNASLSNPVEVVTNNDINIITINPPTPEARRLWAKTLELAEAFGAKGQWALIGGLMVQLHSFEHSGDARPTIDIDVLGDSRRRLGTTRRIATIIDRLGGEMAMPSRSDEDLGYKFEVDGEIVEVLGSDRARTDPATLGGFTTIRVPGGSQALSRTEMVLVSLDGAPPVAVRRPNLLGAILIKACAVAKKRREKFESDRQDLIRLLSFVEDPRALATEGGLKKGERRWLRDIERKLDFSDPSLGEAFPPDALALAVQAYRLFVSIKTTQKSA